MTQFSDLLRIGAAIVPELASTGSSPEDVGDPQPVLNVQRVGAVTSLTASGVFSGTATSAGANDLTLNGTLVTAGVAVFDVERAPILSATSNLSAILFGAYGTNIFGQTISRTGVAGPTAGAPVTFDKAFKTITRFTRSGPVSTALKIGNSYTLGLSRRIDTADRIVSATVDGKNINAAGMPTITVGLAAGVASTATNGDPRGMVLFASNAQPNSSRRLSLVIDSTGLQNNHDLLIGSTQA